MLLNQALDLTKGTLNVDDITREKNNNKKKYLKAVVQIIKTFVIAATKANYTAEQAAVIHLLRKHSSVREAENVPENEEGKAEGVKKEAQAPFSSTENTEPQGVVQGPARPPGDPQSENTQKEGEDKNANTDAVNALQIDFEKTPRFK